MNRVISIEQILDLISKVKNLRKGFLTNFYIDIFKHDIWIKSSDLFFEQVGDTLFFVKQNNEFWNIFYCTTTFEELNLSFNAFNTLYQNQLLIIDVIGNENQCGLINECFIKNGFKKYSSLVRMSRETPKDVINISNEHIFYANDNEAKSILLLLQKYFDPHCEQIPYIEELEEYVKNKKILLYKEEDEILGFVVFEMNKSTLYLRYWFVHPDYRDKKIGSILLNQFFYEGKETRRQLFWVLSNNENAIKRYCHYGFKEENMYDYVLINKNKI